MSVSVQQPLKAEGPQRAAGGSPRSVLGRCLSGLRRFSSDRAGSVGMMFGLLVIPVSAGVGLAVDFGRVYAVNTHTQASLDAAALAAGRVSQVEKVNTVTKASAAADAYFAATKPTNTIKSTLEFSPNALNTEFRVTATSWVRTPFLAVLNSIVPKDSEAGAPAVCQGNYYACIRVVTTATAALCPSSACVTTSGEGGSNVEVAMMLDITLSMDECADGSTGSKCKSSAPKKIDALKDAAKDLIDIVVWKDQSKYTSKIALAPFAEAINVGSTLAPLVRGTVTSNKSSSPQNLSCSDMSNTSKQPTSQWIKFPKVTSNCTGSSTTATWTLSSKCVTERIGTEKFTDAAPGSGAWVGKGYFGDKADTSCGIGKNTDSEVNSVQALTSDVDVLKRRIGKLDTTGSTGGHMGTAWAWYLLSPNWNSVFAEAFSDSAAGPYSDLTTLNAKGMPKLRKIAVLMTDGEYNTNYCKGVEAKDSFSPASPDINCNSENGKSADQAKSLCTAMKDKKIEVFTVGFAIDDADAKKLLEKCATSTSHYYDAATGDALKAAFRDIALKISTLRLTN